MAAEPRGAITSRRIGHGALDALQAHSLPRLAARSAALQAAIPGLKRGWDKGVAEPGCADIDVAGLHAACLKQARAGGAKLVTDARVVAAERQDRWRIETRRGSYQADILVNAAGAWADEVALASGERPLGVTPYRRTIGAARRPPAPPTSLLIDSAGLFYSAGRRRLWLSPTNALDPCDWPRRSTVAIASTADRGSTAG